MATEQQIADLRVMINEPGTEAYSDDSLNIKIEAAEGNLQLAAASVWREKSARYSELVDVQEGSSKRTLSQLQTAALKMAGYYDGLTGVDTGGGTRRAARTRAIERP